MINAARFEHTQLHGWEAVTLTNGLISVTAVPSIGGRLMSLRLGDYEYLFVNAALVGKQFTFEEYAGDGTIKNWKNFGGDKTWPAPQGWDRPDQWPGPPDPILDSGLYTCEPFVNEEGAGVVMISPPDTRHTGLRCTRRITLLSGSARLKLDLTFENISATPIKWSVWNLAQLDCARVLPDKSRAANDQCWLYIGTGAEPGSPDYDVMFGQEIPSYLDQLHPRIAPGVMGVHYQGQIGKIGVRTAANWLAFVNHATGNVLSMTAPYQPDAEYPDNSVSIECWTEGPGAPAPIPLDPPGYQLEAEMLGPLVTLEPGQTTTFSVNYGLARCSGPVRSVHETHCVVEPIHITRTDSGLKVHGALGVFVPGHILWVSDPGSPETFLLHAAPDQPALLDATLPLTDPGTAHGRLVFRPHRGSDVLL